MKGHSAPVNDIAVHPGGTIALSVSRDKQMRLWDLSKGACAYQAPLGSDGNLVVFLKGGSQYAIGTETKVTLHTTQVSTIQLFSCEKGCSFALSLMSLTPVAAAASWSVQCTLVHLVFSLVRYKLVQSANVSRGDSSELFRTKCGTRFLGARSGGGRP
jgi:WD40 repeat protein